MISFEYLMKLVFVSYISPRVANVQTAGLGLDKFSEIIRLPAKRKHFRSTRAVVLAKKSHCEGRFQAITINIFMITQEHLRC